MIGALFTDIFGGRLRRTKLTRGDLARIRKYLRDCPNARLVSGVCGIVTCGGYAIEFGQGSVIHPLAFLDLMNGTPNEPIDILKHA